MTDRSIDPPPLWDKDEDYTGSVCLLLPKGKATLVDLDFFEWACTVEWSVLGRTIFYNERCGRKNRMYSLHRDAIQHGLDFIAAHNLRMRMFRREVDHVNRNPWDNRRQNLRLATKSQNLRNRPGVAGASSRFKGVHAVIRKGGVCWKAQAMVKGKTYLLGTFADETDAAIAYNRFVAARCGEFAYLNPITATPDYTPPERKRRKRRNSQPPD